MPFAVQPAGPAEGVAAQVRQELGALEALRRVEPAALAATLPGELAALVEALLEDSAGPEVPAEWAETEDRGERVEREAAVRAAQGGSTPGALPRRRCRRLS